MYLDHLGRRVRSPDHLARIRALAIPPAWEDVWICTLPNGHLQATGRDARGRKQYRYHDRWRQVRDENKFERLAEFGMSLTPLRRRVRRDLRQPRLPREKVLAAVVWILDTAFVRVGNLSYAKENESFGLTTLRGRHVDVRGSKVRFEFTGKGGKRTSFDLENERLAKIVRRCRDLPGYELFQYVDDGGEPKAIDSADVNHYLQEIGGSDFTAKDFRTWAGSVLAASTLAGMGPATSTRQAKRNVVRAVEAVAGGLGNTPAIARKSYVHPGILDSYLEGTLVESWERPLPQRAPRGTAALRADEARLLRFLKSARGTRQRKAG